MATEGFAEGDVVRSEYEGTEFESVVHDAKDLGYPGLPYLLLDIPGYASPQWWHADRCRKVGRTDDETDSSEDVEDGK